MGQKEEYEEWLYMYRKDRDTKMSERRLKMDADWTLWRSKFGTHCQPALHRCLSRLTTLSFPPLPLCAARFEGSRRGSLREVESEEGGVRRLPLRYERHRRRERADHVPPDGRLHRGGRSPSTSVSPFRPKILSGAAQISVAVSSLRRELAQYMASEVKKTDAFAIARKAALIQEWNNNLKILNGGINRYPSPFIVVPGTDC